MTLSPSTWRKSTYSGDFEDACVEVRAALVIGEGVQVRDSKSRSRRPLNISARAWGLFLTAYSQQ
ncbi:DUF397 domain-containing protein [Streptomyces sp. NPDC020875]|uniref:DUF397 domain-containing protein n=1 Tax=Streptomyces sp. NPDC020875 TaxID=3154898 RepID=UPI0033FEDFCA